jgi:cyclopropane-fatty-acyl-phospholipid synthase
VNGGLDISGDMLGLVSLRRALQDNEPLHSLWRQVARWLFGQIPTDRLSIETQHEFPMEFYLQFLGPTRSYSQALFNYDDEPLDTAQRRKVNFAFDACHLKPGDSVLDIADDWGSFMEHAGQRGVRVTALTRTQESEAFLAHLIAQRQLPCRVLNQDLLQHSPAETYDAIVMPRAMNHLLPDYPTVLRQIRCLLKPGGRVYLDASAFAKRDAKPTFIAQQIFRASLAHLCQQEFLAEVARNHMEVLAVHNDRHNYFLTCKAWAENLEAAQDEISRRWGQALYRVFQLYLWSLAHAFLSHGMEAYRVVLQRPQSG